MMEMKKIGYNYLPIYFGIMITVQNSLKNDGCLKIVVGQ